MIVPSVKIIFLSLLSRHTDIFDLSIRYFYLRPFLRKSQVFCSTPVNFRFLCYFLSFIYSLFLFHFVPKWIFYFSYGFLPHRISAYQNTISRNMILIAFFADASPGCFVLHKPAFQPARKCCAGCLIFFFSKLDITQSRTRLVPEIDGVHRKFQHRNHRTAGFFQFSCCLFQFFFNCTNRFAGGRAFASSWILASNSAFRLFGWPSTFSLNHIGIPPVENGAFRGFCHIGNKFSTPVAVGKTGNLFIQLLKAVGIVSPGRWLP